jgi:hypothetical protein
VPVDGFWSISLYNAEGLFEPNNLNAYTINNITAKKSDNGSVAVQFGGCDGKVLNCLPIVAGWNYMVRLYRPRGQILMALGNSLRHVRQIDITPVINGCCDISLRCSLRCENSSLWAWRTAPIKLDL